MYKFIIFMIIVILLSTKYYSNIEGALYKLANNKIYIISFVFFGVLIYKGAKKKKIYKNELIDKLLSDNIANKNKSPKIAKSQKQQKNPVVIPLKFNEPTIPITTPSTTNL